MRTSSIPHEWIISGRGDPGTDSDRIRKVKCDETKPYCLRCTNSGRVCDGYLPVPPRARRTVPIYQNADEQDDHANGSDSTLVVLSPTAQSPTLFADSPQFLMEPSNEGSGVLSLFHQRTAPRLAGFMDGFFWNELVLQVGDTEPAVRYALAAVNSIYDYCESPGAAAREPAQKRLLHPSYAKGLKQYNKAISELVQRPKTSIPGGEGVHLVCCVLFVCIEMLANERHAAMSHFDQGLQLLAAYGAGREDQPGPLLRADVVRETLVPIFRRLSLQAIMFGREPPLIPLFTQMFSTESLRSTTPFRTMDEANDALVALMDHGLRMVHEIVGLNNQTPGAKYDPERWMLLFEDMKVHQSNILADLDLWLQSFSPLAAITVVTSSTDFKAKLGCNVLRIQHIIEEIWVRTILDLRESAFDEHLANFAMVVHLASDILCMEKAFGGSASNPVFVFEMGVLAPLYFVASKCRQRRIRRAALLLLQSWPRKENLWDPVQISRAAKRMIEIEDKDALDPDAPDDIWPPEWKRIHKMDVDDEFDEHGNPIMVAILYRKPCGLESEWEVIREIV